MLRVGFEPTIAVFELAETVHTLDRTVAVIGATKHIKQNKKQGSLYSKNSNNNNNSMP
jgi:hypothetical protein